MMLKALLHIF